MKETKKIIKEELPGNIDMYYFDTLDTPEKLGNFFINIKDNLLKYYRLRGFHESYNMDYLNKYYEIKVKFEGDNDGTTILKIYGLRYETDEEFKQRIEKQRKAKQAQKLSAKKRVENTKEKELKLLDKLKKKYEKEKKE